MSCPCGIQEDYETCCRPLHAGERQASTALELMRSRYCAFAKGEVDYIIETHDPDKRDEVDPESTRVWADRSEWLGFELVSTDGGEAGDEEGTVEFIARYRMQGDEYAHHETATFRKVEDRWFFSDSEMAAHEPFRRTEAKVGRNEPCPCGSGKKYKKCCARA